AVSLLAADSAGTSGETPPRPFGPWHWAQAKLTKSCAPWATSGLTLLAAGCVAVAAVTMVRAPFVARPRKTPPAKAPPTKTSAASTNTALADSGSQGRRTGG